MKLNSANKAFFALIGLAFAAYLALGAGACALFGVVAYRVTAGDVSLAGGQLWGFVGLASFLAAYVTGWVLCIAALTRQAIATSKLRSRVRKARLLKPAEVTAAEDRVGLNGRVELVDSDDRFSFAYGAFSPRVVVSRGLLESTSAEELNAVLAHERYHVRSWDPLKVVVARAAAAAFFYLPLFRELRSRYIAGRELAADRRAVRAYGERPLVGALYKVVRGPAWVDLGAAAAIGGPQLLDVRVAQLETGEEPRHSIPFGAWVVTVVAGFALLVAFVVAVATFGWPMGMMDTRMAPDHDMGGLNFVPSFLVFGLVIGGIVLVAVRKVRRRASV